jgi:hypothetical protein
MILLLYSSACSLLYRREQTTWRVTLDHSLLKAFASGFGSEQHFKSCGGIHNMSYVNILFVFKVSFLLIKNIMFLFKWFTSWGQVRFEWLVELLSVFYSSDITHTPSCLPVFVPIWQKAGLPCSKAGLNVMLTRSSVPRRKLNRTWTTVLNLTKLLEQFWPLNVWLDRETGSPKCECVFVFRVSFLTFTILVTFITLFLPACLVVWSLSQNMWAIKWIGIIKHYRFCSQTYHWPRGA